MLADSRLSEVQPIVRRGGLHALQSVTAPFLLDLVQTCVIPDLSSQPTGMGAAMMFRLALVASLSLVAATAHALPINGNFETGTFAGWNILGNVGIQGIFAGVAPPEGSFQARVTGGSQSPATVATFLGTTVAQLQAANVPTPGATLSNGSAISQTVAVNAGDQISFQWNFLNNEFPNDDIFNDAAFLVLAIVPAGNSPTFLANTFSSIQGPAPPGFIFQTGYQTFISAPFATAGNVQIGLAAFNVGDNNFASALLVDNFQITSAVPEPASLLLLGTGLFGVAARKLRKKRQ
jgi:PEP-CTERM motif